PRAGNAMTTKKKAKPRRVREPNPELDALRPKYDFSAGVRGKYAGRYPHGSIVVTLDPDVAAVYPSAEAANDALRRLIRSAPPPTSRRRRSGSRGLGAGGGAVEEAAGSRGPSAPWPEISPQLRTNAFKQQQALPSCNQTRLNLAITSHHRHTL